MKSEFRYVCLLVLVSTSITVMMEPKERVTPENEEPRDFGEAFGVCVSRREHSTLECVNRGILSTLQSLHDRDSLEFDQVRLDRADDPRGRNLLDLDYDPKDFGNVLKAAVTLMERRNIKWSLDRLYPGLQMRVGPMLNGNGVLEFVLDEGIVGDRRHAGAGRQLTRHILLPFLLGFKFNLASLIPLMFGFLLIVTKKALLLTKVALFVSGLLGWNGIFSAAPYSTHGLNGFYAYEHGTPAYSYHDHDHFSQRPYRTLQDFSPYDQHVIREVVNVYEGDSAAHRQKKFVWSKNV